MNMRYAMRSEDTEQINVVSWANWNMNRYPELRWLFHVPNGGSRNKQEAVKFKQMGVKAGVSDLCLPYPKGSYCGLFVEMKFGNNRQQDTQKEFLADMAAAGHFVATCYSAEEAIKVIEEYLNLALCYCPEEDFNNKMSIPNNSILKDGKVKGGGQVMTLADLLNTLESADMLRIIKGDEEIFVGYLALFAPEVGHTNCKLYEQYKFDEVVKFRAVPEITHRKWKELNLMSPLRPDETPDFKFQELQMKLYYTIYL